MLRLPSDLYTLCRDILLECDEFESNAKLRALFVIDELYPFLSRLPEAVSKHERVDHSLDVLMPLRLNDRRAVLRLFVAALRACSLPDA